jgi:hypothetical protein
MTGQIRNRWFVETKSSVDVNCIDNVIRGFGDSALGMGHFVLASRSEEQIAIWGKGESAKE